MPSLAAELSRSAIDEAPVSTMKSIAPAVDPRLDLEVTAAVAVELHRAAAAAGLAGAGGGALRAATAISTFGSLAGLAERSCRARRDRPAATTATKMKRQTNDAHGPIQICAAIQSCA